MNRLAYTVVVTPLDEADGGGYLATIPQLPGCMSDGETPDEAVRNVLGAQEAWIEEARETGRPVPKPATLEVRTRSVA
jgi:predicted RNase H-like HicB family nuclease